MDKDGKVTLKDLQAVRPEFPERIFQRLDSDGDGVINQAELDASARLDAAASGPVTPKRVEFEGKTWVADYADEAQVVEYKGKKALHVVGGESALVYLPDVSFQNGVIEADLAGPIFTGLCFRGREDGKRAEKVYFRPQNAGTDKHANTVQYAVIGREDGTWQYLRENFPGKYEAGADIQKEAWFHVRYVIKDASLKVYVNEGEEPVLTVDPMLDGTSKGTVGVWGWDSYFANFKFTPAE